MDARIGGLKSKHPDRDLLVSWKITGRGELLNQLRPGGLSDVLVAQLRAKFGKQSPAVWSIEIECEEPLCVPAEWYDEETIRGDVLRQLRELETKREIELALEEFLPDGHQKSAFAELAKISAADREELLVTASKLCVDLLSVDGDDSD
jgi:DNA repair protein SbcD/Mre11